MAEVETTHISTVCPPPPRAAGSGTNPPAGRGKDSVAAFTLLELMTVMFIFAFLMVIAIGGYTDWGRGAAMRGSGQNVRSALAMTRQWAATHGGPALFVYSNDVAFKRGQYFTVGSDSNVIGQHGYLANGVAFQTNGIEPVGAVSFAGDGSCLMDSATNTVLVIVREYGRGQHGLQATVSVNRAGYAIIEE
ncbi:MAG: hypothetical protein C0404_13990 [Verrucomicrobia bacterium]|nr:hypothetical protein [Verrucomicrobiota bacterium]